jgi:hypothetical protein
MRERRSPHQSFFERSARIAFTFIVLNCSAVVGLWSMLTRKKVWR